MVAGRNYSLDIKEFFKPYIPSTTGETGNSGNRFRGRFGDCHFIIMKNDATNILLAKVKGPRKNVVKGYLLDKLGLFLEALHRKIICICLYLF